MTTKQADEFVSGKATKAVLAAILADETMPEADIREVLLAVSRRFERRADKRAGATKA